MNFSLHKSISTNYIFSFLLFLSLLIGFSRCVPIEDLVDPTVGEFTLQEQYNISDTIILTAILADNFGISNYTVDIEAINGAGLWSYTSTDSVKARLLNLKDTIIIPSENFAIGNYQLTLTAFDASGKSKITTKSFSVGGDGSNPIFTGVDVILPEIILVNSRYVVCRNDIIPIGGIVSDNIGLSILTVQFEGIPYTFKQEDLSGVRLVDVAEIFNGSITIPAVYGDPNNTPITNGTPLNLVFTARDTKGNVSSDTIKFLVNCDDESPVIERIDTNLKSNIIQDGEIVEVIQGQELFITGGKIKDRLGKLKDISVYFNNSTTPFKTWTSINQDSVELSTLLQGDSLPIPIPANVQTTDNYTFIVKATDLDGNETKKTIKIKIKDNEDPTISVTFEVNGIRINSSSNPNAATPVQAGTFITMRGKILEDVALRNYKVTWGTQRQEEVIIDLDQTSLAEFVLPLNVEDTRLINKFEVGQVPVGTLYVLTIYVNDTFDQESEIKYYFIVQ